jgi:transcriptional regulator with XRE-family HTH domain
MSDVAALIRTARRRHGLSQRTLAQLAGTTQAQISRIERGEISPSVSTVARILRAMGERLELSSTPVRSNARTEDLRRDLLELTAGERIGQAIRLSRMLTGVRVTSTPQ